MGDASDLRWEDPEFYDKNVAKVVTQLKHRSDVGYNKYKTTTERTDIDLLGWLQHLQEELMDASIYIERIKEELK